MVEVTIEMLAAIALVWYVTGKHSRARDRRSPRGTFRHSMSRKQARDFARIDRESRRS